MNTAGKGSRVPDGSGRGDGDVTSASPVYCQEEEDHSPDIDGGEGTTGSRIRIR
jgi:hypothetical protein